MSILAGLRFQLIEPCPMLNGCVEKIWVFESNGPLPGEDMKLIVPDGRLLLLIPLCNQLVGRMNGRDHFAPTGKITLVGVSNHPTVVNVAAPAPVASIGAEISAAGAYRLFHLPLREIKDRAHSLADIAGARAGILEERMGELENAVAKVALLQEFLCALLLKKDEDMVFEYCIRRIVTAKGGLSILNLAKDTGYSVRWLRMKFEERLGISPKNFSSIVRFQHCYQALLSDQARFFLRKEFYQHYYDESHFIKEFVRFTGLSPSRLISQKNEFGRIFCGE